MNHTTAMSSNRSRPASRLAAGLLCGVDRLSSDPTGMTEGELVKGMKALGTPVSAIDAAALLCGFDVDGDGRLSPKEFLALLCANGTFL